MNVKDKKGSITVFVLVGLLFMSAFLLLSYANNVNKSKVAKEQYELINEIYQYSNQGLEDIKMLGDATVDGPEVMVLSTINGKMYGAYNPVIPKGFKPINTAAPNAVTNWDAENLEAEVKKGLVIEDASGNQFVWIPVPNLNNFARLQEGSTTNYRGVLYDWTSTNYPDFPWTADGANSREPANLTESEADNFSTSSPLKTKWNEDYYQESFNKMVASVAEYKGFYVGRYEMSFSNNKAQSKAGETSTYNNSDANNWWGLYEKALTYANEENAKLGVRSEMIWGCQYDAMMKWMQSNSMVITSATLTDTSRKNAKTSRNTDRTTGTNGNDLLNNVYDLLGNSFEWTQEAGSTGNRVYRGGYYITSSSPSRRFSYFPKDTRGYEGSRMSLYVEL